MRLLQRNYFGLWIGTTLHSRHCVQLNLGQTPFRYPLTLLSNVAAAIALGPQNDVPTTPQHQEKVKCHACYRIRDQTFRERIHGTRWQCMDCPRDKNFNLCSMHYFLLGGLMHNDSHNFIALHGVVDPDATPSQLVPVLASLPPGGKNYFAIILGYSAFTELLSTSVHAQNRSCSVCGSERVRSAMYLSGKAAGIAVCEPCYRQCPATLLDPNYAPFVRVALVSDSILHLASVPDVRMPPHMP
jgi:hypothetical protein